MQQSSPNVSTWIYATKISVADPSRLELLCTAWNQGLDPAQVVGPRSTYLSPAACPQSHMLPILPLPQNVSHLLPAVPNFALADCGQHNLPASGDHYGTTIAPFGAFYIKIPTSISSPVGHFRDNLISHTNRSPPNDLWALPSGLSSMAMNSKSKVSQTSSSCFEISQHPLFKMLEHHSSLWGVGNIQKNMGK